jgi:hypothetical protein
MSSPTEMQSRSAYSALEQTASAARPWQATQGKTPSRGGPRPGPGPPLLTAGVRPQ